MKKGWRNHNNTLIYTEMQSHTQARAHVRTHTHTQTHTYRCTQAHTHTCMHACAHTDTHTFSLSLPLPPSIESLACFTYQKRSQWLPEWSLAEGWSGRQGSVEQLHAAEDLQTVGWPAGLAVLQPSPWLATGTRPLPGYRCHLRSL